MKNNNLRGCKRETKMVSGGIFPRVKSRLNVSTICFDKPNFFIGIFRIKFPIWELQKRLQPSINKSWNNRVKMEIVFNIESFGLFHESSLCYHYQ